MPRTSPRSPHPISTGLSLAVSLAASLALVLDANGQGCVAARGAGVPMAMNQADAGPGWDLDVSYRWLNSDRHFTGTHEEAQRQAEGSEVINRSHYTDVALTYAFSPRYSVALTVPFVVHDRSQVVRDNNRVILQRFHTQSAGLGDVRVEGNGWLFYPATAHRGNLQLGLGLDLPTGEKDVRDTFQVYDSATRQIVGVERTVDQSIQPGDGGYGVVLTVFGYRALGAGFTGFAGASYTVTPQEKNGVPTFRAGGFEGEMSIADSYLGRMGVEYQLVPTRGISCSLALRVEGVPVEDVIGGSTGFRRPGYAVSVEPGISVSNALWSARLYVPVAVQRNRQQSVPDQQQTAATGVFRRGDAAFADYLVMASISRKL